MRCSDFSGAEQIGVVDRREHDAAALEKDLAGVGVGLDHEHAGLARRAEELQQIRQRNLVDRARHAAHLIGAAAGRDLFAGASSAVRQRRARRS